jgi:hypothetical protein
MHYIKKRNNTRYHFISRFGRLKQLLYKILYATTGNVLVQMHDRSVPVLTTHPSNERVDLHELKQIFSFKSYVKLMPIGRV